MMHAYCNNCDRRQFYLHIEERKDEKQRRPGKEASVTSKFITSTYLKM